ncbi:hypothetical protein J6590_089590, partial [Homalodisca vitripennis]
PLCRHDHLMWNLAFSECRTLGIGKHEVTVTLKVSEVKSKTRGLQMLHVMT